MAPIQADTAISLDARIAGSVTKSDFVHNFVRIAQFLSGVLVTPIFHSFFMVRIQGRENIKNISKPIIIVANHISMYDSFLFRLIADFRLLPLRFMAVNSFDWPLLNLLNRMGVIRFVYAIFGVFVVIPGKGIYTNLEEPKKIIRSGGVVAIYPEGEIHIDRTTIGPFKRGAAILAMQTGAQVLPVAFREVGHTLFRRKVSVVIGKPVTVQKSMTDMEASEMLRGQVKKLFKKA